MENFEGTPFLQPGVCIYCGIGIPPFLITPVMESECGTYFHKMCEDCAEKYHPGWEEEDDEDSDGN